MMTVCTSGFLVLEKQRAEQKQHWRELLRRVPCYQMIRLTQLHSRGCTEDHQHDQ